jgi:16S rRNA (uracil1498-N3)-methyltransferase
MQRYFAIDKVDEKLILSTDDLHHLFNVLRLKKGEHFQIVYNKILYECMVVNPILFDFKYISSSLLVDYKYKLTFFIANPKNDKLEFILQKCTEIGVSKFVIFESERSIAKIDFDTFEKRKNRYEKIVQEAAQQSKQNNIPEVDFLDDVENFKNYEFDQKFVAYETASISDISKFDLCKKAYSISFIVGPEGGFSPREIEKFSLFGFKTISLGSSILRCETAPIYIASVISYLKGGNL